MDTSYLAVRRLSSNWDSDALYLRFRSVRRGDNPVPFQFGATRALPKRKKLSPLAERFGGFSFATTGNASGTQRCALRIPAHGKGKSGWQGGEASALCRMTGGLMRLHTALVEGLVSLGMARLRSPPALS